jgi:AcrR family transcriptional regulator
MSVPTRTRKSRLPAGERRALIVDAALHEFAERGYEAASLGRIAAAAGVARTVLYDHFESKLALFVELLRTQHAELLGFIRPAIAMDLSMRDRMRLTVDGFFRFAEERPEAWRLLFPTHPPVDVDAAAEHRRCRTESNHVYAKMVEPDARAAGIDPDSTAGDIVFLIHQEALRVSARWWHAHPDVPRAELVDAVMVALWSGFGAAERDSNEQ